MSTRLGDPVVGYRVWEPKDGKLCALGGEAWPVGEVRASCRDGKDHPAPASDCGCGLYAVHRKPSRTPAGFVFGAIVGWGPLEVHADGFRAGRARPIALARTAELAAGDLERLARRYRVPLVDFEVLEAVAAEFGASVPLERCPVDRPFLLRALANALGRRERCVPDHDLAGLCRTDFLKRTLAKLEHAPDEVGLEALLVEAWQGPSASGSSAPKRPGRALAALRRALEQELAGPEPDPETTHELLNALNSAHGSVRAAASGIVSRRGPDAVHDAFLLHPDLEEELAPAARARARRILAERGPGLLTSRGEAALLALEPELDDDELSRLVLHMRSSVAVKQLLVQARERGPRLASAVLGRRDRFGHSEAARHLGRRARPLLLRQLRRTPSAFLIRDPAVDGLVGAQELRLAAERALRCASDPIDVVEALALLPGEEARDPLRGLVERLERLDPCAESHLRWRAWNMLCSREQLVRVLDREVIKQLLREPGLGTVNHVLLLREHPDADPAHAERMWEEAELLPRFALDVLRATGHRRQSLCAQALEHVQVAIGDTAKAARLAAAIVVAGEEGRHLEQTSAVARDVDLPATVRAVASFVAGTPESSTDPALERYERWLARAPSSRHDAVVELLSGVWESRVLL